MTRFADQHFVVTGGGTGIGRAIAERLSSEGAKISLLGRRVEPLQETAEALDGESFFTSCDVRDQASVDAAFAAAVAAHGPIHGLVANAGIGGANTPGPDDRFLDIVNTNLVGSYWCARAAERHLVDAGHIVVIASILGRFGVPGYTGYCASKTGLFGLVRALAQELAGRKIQVNAVAPGWVETKMATDGLAGLAEDWGMTYEEAHAQAMSQVPLGRMSQPSEVAGLVAWLVSPDGRGVTGQGIDMNNGAWM